jgi:FkbM family methyltransferase
MLCANVRAGNVTFVNAAASSRASIENMGVPDGNAYRAAIGDGDIRVMCLRIDALELPQRIALLKVDAEGHDLQVLAGAEQTIRRDRPTIIVESVDAEAWLAQRGYTLSRYLGSPNAVAIPGEA